MPNRLDEDSELVAEQSLTESGITTPSTEHSKRSAKPERGSKLTLQATSFAFEGKAVARREDGYVVFIDGALAGETVAVEILKAKGSFAEAKVVEIIEPSPERREPICPYFGTCGGCSTQHMSYDAQLYWKREQVRELFQRIGGIESPNVLATLGDPNREFRYRNKMEFSFSMERWLSKEEIGSEIALDRFALGLHVRNRFDRVIDAKVCFLPQEISVRILNHTRDFVKKHGVSVYQDYDRPGYLRYLVIKTSYATNEVMVNLVTSTHEPEIMDEYTRYLLEREPAITTITNNINSKRAQIAVGDEEVIYHGSGTIRDKIGNLYYQISANSFFQSNTPQAELLYQTACDFAELKSSDTLWDLYCGTGTITLFAAQKVKRALGIELVDSAIKDARANAIANNFEHVDFVASDLRHALTTPEFLSQHERPTAMIIDPPRSGMHKDVVEEVLKLAPERIAYISCNPATQARDIALMTNDYELEVLQPVDMFPQTFHIECVAKLRRRVA